jgi:hypothetical protein
MGEFGIEEVKKSVENVINKLSLTIDDSILDNYQNGFIPDLLTYEKVEIPSIEIPCLYKYLIGAKSYLNQPTQFYDIFRSNRHSILIQKLSDALNNFASTGINVEKRLQRLVSEIEYDAFESVLFELLVAHKYLLNPNVNSLSFLEETEEKTPDIEIKLTNKTYYIECKKYNRINNIFPIIRNKVNELVNPLFKYIYSLGKCLIIELTFFVSPENIDKDIFIREVQLAISQDKSFKNDFYEILLCENSSIRFESYTLNPSPKFYSERYNYRTKSEWQGLITRMNAKYAYPISNIGKNSNYSSWLDEIDWDCAFKWKISNQEFLWQQKKMAYNLIFKGLAQLKHKSDNSILHVWIERDPSVGNRKNELLNFYKHINNNSMDKFAWLIFNETEFSVSLNGHFDLIEYAHIIGGPTRTTHEPAITLILNDPDSGMEEFGVGHIYPE